MLTDGWVVVREEATAGPPDRENSDGEVKSYLLKTILALQIEWKKALTAKAAVVIQLDTLEQQVEILREDKLQMQNELDDIKNKRGVDAEMYPDKMTIATQTEFAYVEEEGSVTPVPETPLQTPYSPASPQGLFSTESSAHSFQSASALKSFSMSPTYVEDETYEEDETTPWERPLKRNYRRYRKHYDDLPKPPDMSSVRARQISFPIDYNFYDPENENDTNMTSEVIEQEEPDDNGHQKPSSNDSNINGETTSEKDSFWRLSLKPPRIAKESTQVTLENRRQHHKVYFRVRPYCPDDDI